MTTTSRRAPLGTGPGHRTVRLEGITLAYDDEGAGPPVVCLHAIGHGASDFASLRARLSDRHRVVALDWPGHGRSTADTVPAGASRYAALLAELLDAARITRPVLIGNSIGGAVALRYAAARPDAVRGLVLENPGGLAPVDDRLARTALAAMARFFDAGARGAWWFPRAYAAYYRTCVLLRGAAAAQRRRIVAAGREMAPVLRDAWRSFANPAEDARALAPHVACPVLFAWARFDQFVPLSRSLPAVERVPDARVVRFAAGHAAHLETPAAFESAVEAFLAELDARDGAAAQRDTAAM
jgi:4,5:9,10-diseco-3-hydroxy-5,9,17-trioxoandrosta-1(10),2-diene-4-oate hydrolase